MKKSQVTTEFILAMALIFTIFLVFMVLIFEQNVKIRDIGDEIKIKQECTRISNLISSVYNLKSGTSINTRSNYVINVFNKSYIEIKPLQNYSSNQSRIAILVSEAAESTQTFYDSANAKFHPDWYKVCFSDKNGAGCQSSGTDVNYNNIPKNLSDLIKILSDNPDQYTTLYLEDAHLHPSSMYNGKSYVQIINDWVGSGHSIVISEHFYCRDNSGGSSTTMVCGPGDEPTSDGDRWRFFDNNLTQLGSNSQVSVISPVIPYYLDYGKLFTMEENSNVEILYNISNFQRNQAESLALNGGYASSATCTCSSPSGGSCIKSNAGVLVQSNATYTFNRPSGTYSLIINYCGRNTGNDTWNVYLNNNKIYSWDSYYKTPWQNKTIKNIAINNNDIIKISCKRGTTSSDCAMDYLVTGDYQDKNENTVASYNSNNKPALVFWRYKNGYIHYLADLQEVSGLQTEYTNFIVNLVENANLLLFSSSNKHTQTCSFFGESPNYEITKNFTISNVNGTIMIIQNP